MSSRRIVIREGAAALAADFIPSEAESTAAADAEDLASVSGFASASRRAERLAWRKLLREVLAEHFGCAFPEGLRIEYSASGAPRLKDFPDIEISVSHCRDMAAIVVSHTGATTESRCDGSGACGVDIERADRNFDRVTSPPPNGRCRPTRVCPPRCGAPRSVCSRCRDARGSTCCAT